MTLPSRDSMLFYLLAIAAGLGYLQTMPPVMLWDYHQWLQAALGVVLYFAGKMQTSPLPGENDANKVKSSSIAPMILFAAALGAGALSLTACAGNGLPKLPTSTPAIASMATTSVAQTDEALRASADHMLGLLDASQDALEEVIVAEKKVEGLMPPSMVTTTRAQLHRINDALVEGANGVKSASRTAASLKSIADKVLANVQDLATLISTLPPSAQSRGGIGAALSILVRLAGSLIGAAPNVSGTISPEGI